MSEATPPETGAGTAFGQNSKSSLAGETFPYGKPKSFDPARIEVKAGIVLLKQHPKKLKSSAFNRVFEGMINQVSPKKRLTAISEQKEGFS